MCVAQPKLYAWNGFADAVKRIVSADEQLPKFGWQAVRVADVLDEDVAVGVIVWQRLPAVVTTSTFGAEVTEEIAFVAVTETL